MATNNSWDEPTAIGESSGGTNQTTYTKGDILYASDTNTLSKLAIGTDDQILTVSTDVPAWSAGVPGNEVVLSSQTASDSESLDYKSLINSSLYSFYRFAIISVQPATDTDNLLMLWSVDNGDAWLAGTTYQWARHFANSSGEGNAGSTGDSSITIATSMGTGTGEGGSGDIFYYPSVTPSSTYQQSTWNFSNFDSGAVLQKYSGSGLNTTTSEVNAIQFIMSSGDISSGKIVMYGTLL